MRPLTISERHPSLGHRHDRRNFFLSLSDPQDVIRTLYYTRIMSLVTLKMNTTLEELSSKLKLT